MSERAASTESAHLIEQLLPIRSDPRKLLKALKRQNIATIGEVVSRLLDNVLVDEENATKRPKLAPSRLRIPNETFEDVMFFLDRDTLDSMQLACHFTLDFILKREEKQLALRDISEVEIGKIIENVSEDHYDKCWLPISYVARSPDDGQLLNSTHRLSAFLRLSHCEDVCIDLEYLQDMAEANDGYTVYMAESGPNQPGSDNIYCVLFDDLNVKDTSVDVLTVKLEKCDAYMVRRCISAFKSVSKVRLDADNLDSSDEEFDEDFFESLALRDVWSFEFCAYDGVEMAAKTALVFGFPKYTTESDRRLAGILLKAESDLLEEVRKKASELDGEEEIDIEFVISKHPDSRKINPAGFENYQKRKGKWIFDDLENKITVEVKETKDFVDIYAYSSA